jgi:aspartate kinase
VVENSKKVEQASFRELREMSYMGASVLHAETLLPLYDNPIPIVIKNSFAPNLLGTRIMKKRTEVSDRETITCITGKNDYTCIQISKTMLDKQLGFVKKATAVFERYHINISHTHSGLDNLCFFVEHSQYTQISFENFLKELSQNINADRIKGYEKIALLAVIGHNLSGKIGILSGIFQALKDCAINVRTIYQSISECNIIIGVENNRLNDGIRAIYQALIQ